MKNLFIVLFISLSALTLFSAGSDQTLIHDFGGKNGLVTIVDDMMVGLLADPKMKPHFVNVDQKRLKEQLVEQFCELLGGPCKYTGKSMEKAHGGLDISRGEFNNLVEVLRAAMNKNDVPMRSQNKLLALLAPMHKDVIRK